MIGGFPTDPPPDGSQDALNRARRWLRRVARAMRRAVASSGTNLDARRRAFGTRLGQGARWIQGTLRRRLSGLRPHLRGVEREIGRVLDRTRPRLRRLSNELGRGWRRVRALLEEVGRDLGRRAPTRRQAAILAVVFFAIGWTVWQRCGVAGCPDVELLTSYQPGGASVLLDREGEPFADLAPMEYRVVPLDSLPEYVGQAFVAVEDKRFFDHRGVDWLRVLGAAWADLRAGGFVQGSSTLPMQLSRTLFPDRIRREEKTLRRKLLEVRVTGEIEDRFSKEEILELYLNHVYLGGGAYGIQAASRYYFGKDARALELHEAALLAALPKAPAHYDPRRHPEAAKTRRDLVLTLMEEQGYLEGEVARAAREQPLGVADEPVRDRDGERLAPYFVRHVRRLLEEELGEALYAEPLRIYTTLDSRAQRAAEAELEAQLRTVERGAFGRLSGASYSSSAGTGPDGTDYLQGAVVLMDVHGGAVRAWVGGRDYDDSRFDRARLAWRQTGSAFKPFVYGAAFEAGFAPSQPILDEPYRLASDGGPDWRPRNYSGRFEGRMSMREALVRSQNVPVIRLAAAVGDDRVRDFARRAGLTGEIPASPVAALGVTAASPLEMTVAYASIAGHGRRPVPRFVLRVEDADGDVLLETEPKHVDVTDSATAYLLTDILRDVVDRGTGAGVRSVGFRGAAGGKTGTTDDATDAWFVGFTSELVGTVWVGFDEVRPLPARATGGGVAAPVWGRIMAAVYDDRPVPEWPKRPAGVIVLHTDPETGMPLEEGCRPSRDDARLELFVEGSEPAFICPRRGGGGLLDRIGGWFGSIFGNQRSGSRIPGEPDPDLGVPRLPRRGEDVEPGLRRTSAAP